MVKTDTQQDNKVNQSDNKSEVSNEKSDETPELRENEWMIRPCDQYKYEYKDCRSFLGRFYQYYIDGGNHVCQQWKTDYENCKKWKKNQDEEAFNCLVESEKMHRLARWKGHLNNDVWERRQNPPSDWNDPLPDYLNERNQGTYLALKQQALKEGINDDLDLYIPQSCVIM
ncbi:UPF0545 protein C22orf39 homolog [Chelonus insularis]|uniref:UPF0545 protein C22orf39 homolog n=1 Tax=Chelonus insularis TaxID=460826 RepID=UPI0015899834|nr:UPF0545 protein C22orf39 homolog [Chelonus insularis]